MHRVAKTLQKHCKNTVKTKLQKYALPTFDLFGQIGIKKDPHPRGVRVYVWGEVFAILKSKSDRKITGR